MIYKDICRKRDDTNPAFSPSFLNNKKRKWPTSTLDALEEGNHASTTTDANADKTIHRMKKYILH
jgi:hypothetical protein